MAYLLPISHAWLLILCYASTEKEREGGGGQKDVTEYICIQEESYRTRDESSMGEAIISSQVIRMVRKRTSEKEARNVLAALRLR